MKVVGLAYRGICDVFVEFDWEGRGIRLQMHEKPDAGYGEATCCTAHLSGDLAVQIGSALVELGKALRELEHTNERVSEDRGSSGGDG